MKGFFVVENIFMHFLLLYALQEMRLLIAYCTLLGVSFSNKVIASPLLIAIEKKSIIELRYHGILIWLNKFLKKY